MTKLISDHQTPVFWVFF